MSLSGVRVGLTASRERSESISFLLEDEGVELVHLPLLELRPPADSRPFAAMTEQLQRHPWILLSSLEAVTALWEGARLAGTLDRLSKVGLIATDVSVANLLASLGQPARIELDPSGALELDSDDEVLIPVGDGDSPWPTRIAQRGALAIAVLAWTPAVVRLPQFPPELILFQGLGTASALHRDQPAWLQSAVRVAGSAKTADELSRLGAPAHSVAGPGAEGLLDAALLAWKR